MNPSPKAQAPETPLTLLTGATGFIGWRLALALATRGHRLALLCRPASAEGLEQRLRHWPEQALPPRIVLGDLRQADLGLGDPDRRELQENATGIFHLAARYNLGMTDEEAQAANVDGTARVLELAAASQRKPRVHHMSSIVVSGDYDGLYGEEDFDLGQQPLYPYSRSKFEAEKLVRSSGLPASIYRAGVVVGDSRTGEMDKVDGPYYVFKILHLIRKLPKAASLPMIVPRDDDSFFHLVPVDFVVEALRALAEEDSAAPLQCWHLCDPDPPSFRQFYLATLDAYGLRGPRIGRPVRRLFRLLYKPGPFAVVKRAGKLLGIPAEMLPHVLLDVRYDTRKTTAALARFGLSCPALLPLLPRLVDAFEAHLTR